MRLVKFFRILFLKMYLKELLTVFNVLYQEKKKVSVVIGFFVKPDL